MLMSVVTQIEVSNLLFSLFFLLLLKIFNVFQKEKELFKNASVKEKFEKIKYDLNLIKLKLSTEV